VPEGLKQVDSSVAWPLSDAWSVYGRVVYSLKDGSAIERLGGFEYRSCCWGVRLLARRSVSSITGSSDWEIKAQLELTGLSNVGNPVDTFLAGAIQGYSAARNDFSSTPIKPP
jgi:LPS-assembly protein